MAIPGIPLQSKGLGPISKRGSSIIGLFIAVPLGILSNSSLLQSVEAQKDNVDLLFADQQQLWKSR